ncbi:hypothetical protein IGI04_033994 [Brassica rapa subsp. trilocularis]|uniref:Uncharacterized protein n=1 Tax=Brassica rapa subsp. trilocularis TaxID=1813537 RepID=A0ABQ7L7G1_BRACM|nr:hypothetical protein IGI04_033994 [Brassica rapa subsp. trilocularis]
MVEGILSKAFWVVCATVFAAATVVYGQQVPCYFIFGDSTFDSGNNNNLQSKAKVNYSPYGIDFPGGPTGRFINRRTIADVIGELSGFEDFIPPFAGASPKQAHTGINYASGGGGLRKETSEHLGGRISLRKQIQNHKKAIKKAKVPAQRLEQCLYTINIGSNDYINNYFMSETYSTSSLFNPNQYAYFLNRLYRTHLKWNIAIDFFFGKVNILNLKKKFFIHKQRVQNIYITILKVSCLSRSKNNYLVCLTIFIRNEMMYYMVAYKGCCTISPGEKLCVPNKPVCANRSEYLFWDDIHSSEATNKMAAKGSFDGPLGSPYSIAQLVKQ